MSPEAPSRVVQPKQPSRVGLGARARSLAKKKVRVAYLKGVHKIKCETEKLERLHPSASQQNNFWANHNQPPQSVNHFHIYTNPENSRYYTNRENRGHRHESFRRDLENRSYRHESPSRNRRTHDRRHESTSQEWESQFHSRYSTHPEDRHRHRVSSNWDKENRVQRHESTNRNRESQLLSCYPTYREDRDRPIHGTLNHSTELQDNNSFDTERENGYNSDMEPQQGDDGYGTEPKADYNPDLDQPESDDEHGTGSQNDYNPGLDQPESDDEHGTGSQNGYNPDLEHPQSDDDHAIEPEDLSDPNTEYYGVYRDQVPKIFDWANLRTQLAALCSEFLPTHIYFPYRYLMFFSRKSNASNGFDAHRYMAFRLQIDLLRAWINAKHQVQLPGVRPSKSSITICQYWCERKANVPIKYKIPRPTEAHTRPAQEAGEFICDIPDVQPPGRNAPPARKAYLFHSYHGHTRIWKSVSKRDGALVLLHGATALTSDEDFWKALAQRHSENATSTQVVIFETRGTQLAKKNYYKSLGSGYYFHQYDLKLIGKYLDDKTNAPEIYADLFDVWEKVGTSRSQLSNAFRLKEQTEGEGRTFRKCRQMSRADQIAMNIAKGKKVKRKTGKKRRS